ncbi:MAG: glutamine amidotransferase [Deltaproteobacteria bacterium]|nr:MAG: glutamine amidotransferase [Deltaproteobacteria bacterium]
MQNFLIVKLGTTFPLIAKNHGDFDDWIKTNLGWNPDKIWVLKPYSGERLPNPRQVSGVVVTGSHAMVTDQENWSEYTAAWLRKVIAAQTPLLGICYGHQLLAYALGGRVGPSPQGGEFGTVQTRLNEQARKDALFGGLPHLMPVQVCHSQFVLKLPPGARLLASSDRDPHHAFAYGAVAWGIQFHPEFNRDILISYIRAFSNTLLSEGQKPETLIGSASNTPYGKELLRRFGKIVWENEQKAR